MLRIHTMGFSGKSAEQFFTALHKAGIERLIDVRRSNNTLYNGFTRRRDLPFLLRQISQIDYLHEPQFAPSEELLRDYQRRLKVNKKDPAAWPDYVSRFLAEIRARPILELFRQHTDGFSNVCFLCTEPTADFCHRRLLAEHIGEAIGPAGIEIIHL